MCIYVFIIIYCINDCKSYIYGMKKLFTLGVVAMITLSSAAQESSNTAGGDATGSGGKASYTIGQVAYQHEAGSSGNVNQGVQQPYEIYSVGIEENTAIVLSAFPNPTSDKLTLRFDEYSNEPMHMNLLDIQGKLIQSVKINNAQTEIDLSANSKGIYFVKLFSESKEIKTFKIIKN